MVHTIYTRDMMAMGFFIPFVLSCSSSGLLRGLFPCFVLHNYICTLEEDRECKLFAIKSFSGAHLFIYFPLL